MKVIFKYFLYSADVGTIDDLRVKIPKERKIIHFGYDANRQACLWAEVKDDTPESEMEVLEIARVGTGWPLDNYGEHLGSLVNEPFVWHYYLKS